MSEPDWAKVLQYFYQEADSEIQFYEGHPAEELDVVKDIDIEQDDLKRILNHMEEIGLLEYKEVPVSVAKEGEYYKTKAANFTLSEKGFDVAHQRELNKGQKIINRDIRNLTIILAFTASIQALAAAFSVELPYQVFISIFCLILIIILIRNNFI